MINAEEAGKELLKPVAWLLKNTSCTVCYNVAISALIIELQKLQSDITDNLCKEHKDKVSNLDKD